MLTIDRQTGRGRTAQFNAVPKDCGAIGHSFQRLCGGGEERSEKGAMQWVPPSLLMLQLNMVFRKVEGGREGRDDEDDCDTGLISLAKCVLSDPPAAAGSCDGAATARARTVVYFRAVGSVGEREGEPRNGPF